MFLLPWESKTYMRSIFLSVYSSDMHFLPYCSLFAFLLAVLRKTHSSIPSLGSITQHWSWQHHLCDSPKLCCPKLAPELRSTMWWGVTLWYQLSRWARINRMHFNIKGYSTRNIFSSLGTVTMCYHIVFLLLLLFLIFTHCSILLQIFPHRMLRNWDLP